MAGAYPNSSDFSTAICPQCGETLRVQLGRGSRILCTNRACRAKLNVDSLEIVDLKPKSRSSAPEKPEPSAKPRRATLDMADLDVPIKQRRPRSSEHERLHIPATVKSPRKPVKPAKDAWPDPLDEIPQKEKKEKARKVYDLLDDEDEPDVSRPRGSGPREKREPEEEAAPPRWPFLSGVFTFPWYPDTKLCWAMLSAGFVGMGGIGAVALALALRAYGTSGLLLALLAIPEIWLILITFGTCAAYSLAIVEETAGGADAISNWPEPNWRGWGIQLIYLGYISLLAGGAGYAISQFAADLTHTAQPLATMNSDGDLVAADISVFISKATAVSAGLFLVFPILLLASLESGSMWAPVSMTVLQSLVSLWWAWLLFYLEAALLAAIWLAFVWVGSRYSLKWTIVASGPLVAANVLIYARLLGRLAWLVSETLGAEIAESKADEE